MIRENKYLVLKTSDIEKYLDDDHQLKLSLITTKIRVGRLNDGKQDQQYVVVAADWPMYEIVWGMVEAFVDGRPSEIESLTEKVKELEAENTRISNVLSDEWDRHDMTRKRLSQQLTAEQDQVARLRAMSVTNIMIAVVPGDGDGDGQEVFAASVSDVEALLTKLSEKAEDYDLVTVPLRQQLQAEQSKVKVLSDALKTCKSSTRFNLQEEPITTFYFDHKKVIDALAAAKGVKCWMYETVEDMLEALRINLHERIDAMEGINYAA